jgi:methylmalonyl-CoA mutase C-terminal domain/subunit
MLDTTWVIDHVGIAVTDLNEATQWYSKTMSAIASHRERLDAQGVELVFIETGGAKVELLAPTRPDSTLAKFIVKRGPGLHHVCYRVPDVQRELTRLSGMGIKLIDQHPRPGAGGTKIAFLHPSSCHGSLIEICEYPVT